MAFLAAKTLELRVKDGKPATSVVIRSCLPEDAPLFRPFWEVVSRESTHTYQTPEFPPDFSKVEENWKTAHESPFLIRIGAFDVFGGAERLVGQLGVHSTFLDHPWTQHVCVFGMMVRGEIWGRGVGRALLEAMEAHAKSIGVVKIEATVRAENGRGLKFYTSAGYRIEGRRTRGAKIAGRYQDELYIAKDLDAKA
jgi:RimJ/RimL family protein N-acetyltransferase